MKKTRTNPRWTFPSSPLPPNILNHRVAIGTMFLFRNHKSQLLSTYCHRHLSPCLIVSKSQDQHIFPKLRKHLVKLVGASVILLLGLGICTRSASASTRVPPAYSRQTYQHQTIQENDDGKTSEISFEDEETRAAFESWKARTYSLTVPLRIIALRSSVPPLWIKNFMQAQGKRTKLRMEFRGSINDIFSELSVGFSKTDAARRSAVTADIVALGDTWLSFAIKKALIEPIQSIEDQEWFAGLSDKWKVYLRRNSEGKLDVEGKVWAAPYRWGSMVIAFKKSKFQKNNLAPIEDWADLWRPELSGKISMVDSPREVIGAVLKYMGASYNTSNFDTEVVGGRNAVLQKLSLLENQVRLFDSVHYLKAFEVGDVWVTVGWSSDIIPAAKRMSDVAVIVPKSGASLWADVWAIPAASEIKSEKIGGRVRGPSPLVHQWLEFCLQSERALPFKEEVVPGASPSALEGIPVEAIVEPHKNKPKLDTNLIGGVPPAEILKRYLSRSPVQVTYESLKGRVEEFKVFMLSAVEPRAVCQRKLA
ncbi:Spermidine-binding periplasmic protein SpuE [Heracleum sosnowskyi]|uniref:Spermidine-binding periplasmic protein SpuE n=1 Tax=Heracleum sosnowskyi TaxID=360622 RepID=A0AAD8JHP7_9APIA|nr:Spermidine-binding periplasmic protein SpuE [Heracleum sosnowskyi]